MKIDKLKKHTSIYLIGKLVSSGFTYLAIVLFIRVIGTEEYGRYALVYSFIMFTITFSSGWINQIILRYGFESLKNVLSLFFSFSIVLGSFALTLLLVFSPDISIMLIFNAIGIFIVGFLYSIKLTKYQVETRVADYSFFEAFRTFLFFILPLIIFIYARSLTYKNILFSILISYIIILFYKQEHVHCKIKILFNKEFYLRNRNRVIEYIKYGIPIGLWLGTAYLLNVIDRYFIVRLDSYANAGIYASIYDITYKSFSLVFVPILNAAHPLIMNYWKTNRAESRTILKKSLNYELLLFPVILIFMIFFSPILATTMGLDNELFIKIVIPISIGSFLWHVSMLLHKPLELEKQTFLMFKFVLLALIINIIGNLIFIPIFGFLAAAYTTIISALLYIVLVFSTWKTRK